jgi:hypothetical protein
MSPGMIHENLSHDPSGNGQEMGPALPIDACLTDELQVGFVNQRGRLKSMALSFPVQVSRGKCPQFGVDVGKQLLFGMAIPWFEFLQELSDPSRSARFHGRSTHQGLPLREDSVGNHDAKYEPDNAISLCPSCVALRGDVGALYGESEQVGRKGQNGDETSSGTLAWGAVQLNWRSG